MLYQLDLPSITDFVANCILYYDFVLTFGREVEFFWKLPRSWTFWLFITNRYVTILSRILPVFGIFWPLKKGENGALVQFCRTSGMYDQFVIIIVQMIGGAVMITRVYALYEKSRRVLVFLVTFSHHNSGARHGQWAVLALPSSDALSVPTPSLHCGCNVPITFEQAQHMAIAWGGQLAFDAIIFVLTLSRTLRIGKLGSRALLDVLIRDGTLYFGIITAANAGNITAFLVCQTVRITKDSQAIHLRASRPVCDEVYFCWLHKHNIRYDDFATYAQPSRPDVWSVTITDAFKT
ncbi:hypothetical protein ID866_8392 [Astraeus odoratus]|nr:hypothetical protein ID866_8392 [Astraeus odoratus]